jgi:hypothetical protein
MGDLRQRVRPKYLIDEMRVISYEQAEMIGPHLWHGMSIQDAAILTAQCHCRCPIVDARRERDSKIGSRGVCTPLVFFPKDPWTPRIH